MSLSASIFLSLDVVIKTQPNGSDCTSPSGISGEAHLTPVDSSPISSVDRLDNQGTYVWVL